MPTFFMLGRYSAESLQAASPERTAEAKTIVKRNRGRIRSIFALQGSYDLIVQVEFPGTEAAMRASVALTRLTGIGFTTLPALPVDRFDQFLN